MSRTVFLTLFFAASSILCVNNAPSIESYSYQIITGPLLQENSLDGNSLPSFTSTGVTDSGSLGSTIPQSLRKVTRGDVTMIVGGEKNSSSAICLRGGRVLSRFSVCNTNGAQDVRSSPLGFIVFCRRGQIKLFNAITCQPMNSLPLRPYSTLAVLSSPDNVTFTAYITRHGNLVRYEFKGGSITLYTQSDIASTFGTCSVEWSPRTYNDTHFIFECPSSNLRYLVDGFISNSNKEAPAGLLSINTGEDEAVVITGDHSLSFYWKGFNSRCRINVPQSTSLLTDPTTIDFGKNNGQTVIFLFNNYNTFVYDTSRGCKDEYLQRLNVTYPCVTGKCDGYYIVEDGPYFVAVNNRSSKLTLDLFYFNDATAAPHTITNLQELPDVLNVNKSQVHNTSPQVISIITDTMISSQTITSTTSTIESSSSPSLLITSPSTTSSTLSSSPSPTLSPQTEVSHHLYVGSAIALAFVVIIISIIIVAAICVINHQKHKKSQNPASVSITTDSASNPSTRSCSVEPIDVYVTEAEPRQESGLTAIPIPALPSITISASPSINSFSDGYKRPTAEESNPDPASLV
ncbi:PREDICTED: uncharacterized protein LOC109582506 [Amphimedon queenslandica]|uniref:Uncharacterized protein n=1 Tax=Amphimedon queenslandica TaxID=400682 RepID=A0A1X7VTF2_AMPQE|nr:PREDICTED: uncharacterized protein LOC109582506 [Amphimedon queenslandica]|eukprot:XP_019852801.1 PREDICTED: uncharacterized protein LOC109582506 [Amphimedon queenslandica]